MTAEIIIFDNKKKENHCSFCHTPESKCKTFFQGIGEKFICDKCLSKCSELAKHTAT